MSSDTENTIDRSQYDQRIAELADRKFVRKVFHSYPCLRSKEGDHWIPHRDEPYDETAWDLIPGGWDHEHCSLCCADIVDGMVYWANENEVIILCDAHHDHYQHALEHDVT